MNVLRDIGSFLLLALISMNALKIKMPVLMVKYASILKETIPVKHQRNLRYNNCWGYTSINKRFQENNACPLGFKESDGKCEDLNECQTGEHNCLQSPRCDNTLGSFVCTR